MLRRYGSVLLALALVGGVTTACVVRTRPAHRTVHVREDGKHKKQKHHKHAKHAKHAKHKKHHD